MEGHRLRIGALAWSSSMLSSGSRDKSILQRDIRAQEDFVSKLSGHKSEVLSEYSSRPVLLSFRTHSVLSDFHLMNLTHSNSSFSKFVLSVTCLLYCMLSI